MKRIGVLTTGGDCSGLNTAIWRIIQGAHLRGWRVFGIIDGTDGLCTTPPNVIELNNDVFVLIAVDIRVRISIILLSYIFILYNSSSVGK